MAQPDNEYDIFISYAHFDHQDEPLLPALLEALNTIYRRLTGYPLRVFLDTHKIETAQMWEKRIESALTKSSIMIALLSPAYFTSEWCGKEWAYFAQIEQRTRDALNLPPEMGLIFPVKITDWSRVFRLPRDRQAQIADAGQRQFISLEHCPPGSEAFQQAVSELAEDVIDVLRQLYRARMAADPVTGEPGDAVGAAPQSQVALAPVVRIGANREMFIQRLSEATRVVIIGITNQRLVRFLDQALARKRERYGEDAFWFSLRVVFPGEKVLHNICDELAADMPDAASATAQRIRAAGQAKRALSHFLIRANKPRTWKLYEYNYALPFIGAMFEMPNNEVIVQLATLRPTFSTRDHLFLEFSTAQQPQVVAYYQAAFDEVIQRSRHQEEIIVIGRPQYPLDSNQIGFISHHARFRRSVLEAGERGGDWIAAIIAILLHEHNGVRLPLLQVRTPENATRELDMLSSISGYINQQDCQEFDSGAAAEFILQPAAPENAVRRELQEELGLEETDWEDMRLLREIRFYYPHLENFYFYVYTARVNAAGFNRALPAAYLRPWPFEQIMCVREYQVLNKVINFLRLEDRQRSGLVTACDVLCDNLVLHGRADLAARLRAAAETPEIVQNLMAEIEHVRDGLRVEYHLYGERRTIQGLAGLQYREFFGALVPVYAEMGVEGAPALLEWLNTDESATSALKRLKRHYSSETAVRDAGLDV